MVYDKEFRFIDWGLEFNDFLNMLVIYKFYRISSEYIFGWEILYDYKLSIFNISLEVRFILKLVSCEIIKDLKSLMKKE